jgi:hypothetical protein
MRLLSFSTEDFIELLEPQRHHPLAGAGYEADPPPAKAGQTRQQHSGLVAL